MPKGRFQKRNSVFKTPFSDCFVENSHPRGRTARRWANCLQAVMFAAFLYTIGVRYWAPFGMFGYAWGQGWVFNKTKSLLFVLVVHICVDLLVCFVLLHAYYPDLVHIFVIG